MKGKKTCKKLRRIKMQSDHLPFRSRDLPCPYVLQSKNVSGITIYRFFTYFN